LGTSAGDPNNCVERTLLLAHRFSIAENLTSAHRHVRSSGSAWH
jgi:hypothetical protein